MLEADWETEVLETLKDILLAERMLYEYLIKKGENKDETKQV